MRTLYYHPLSPGCRKIRVLLKEKELVYDGVALHSLGKAEDGALIPTSAELPLLLEENEERIIGMYAITEYLEESYPSPTFLGTTHRDKSEVRRLVEWFDVRMQQEVTQPLLHEKIFKQLFRLGTPDSTIIRNGKHFLLFYLNAIAELVKEGGWLAGNYLTLADITAACHLSCLDYLGDVAWEQAPVTREWYALIKSRPSFRAVLVDRVGSLKPPGHYENPDF